MYEEIVQFILDKKNGDSVHGDQLRMMVLPTVVVELDAEVSGLALRENV